MSDFFDALTNVVVDRSADELIGAVMIALGLSLAFAGLDFVSRRKVRDARMPMIVLMIGANLASMAIAAGYLVHARRTRAPSAAERGQSAMVRPDPVLVDSIFRTADKNQDGLLSSDEASFAAAEFVRHADLSGKGAIDAPTLAHALPAVGFTRGRRPAGSLMPIESPPPGPRSRRGFRPPEIDPARTVEPLPSIDHDKASSTAAAHPSSDPGTEPAHVKK
jgi:hypothetical protein